jgi:hypothetical protein
METIPPIFWMFIIFALALGVFLILFYIAMAVRESINLIRESTGVLHEVKDIAREAKTIIADIQSISSGFKGVVTKINGIIETVNDNIVGPIMAIGGFLSSVSNYVPGRKKKRAVTEEEI